VQEDEGDLALQEPDSFGTLAVSFEEMESTAKSALENRTRRLQGMYDEMAERGVHYKGWFLRSTDRILNLRKEQRNVNTKYMSFFFLCFFLFFFFFFFFLFLSRTEEKVGKIFVHSLQRPTP
jgi:hypothetical protein